MVWIAPSKIMLKLSWDNERIASSVFTLLQRKKSFGVKPGKSEGW
jgi:hypothetical protein